MRRAVLLDREPMPSHPYIVRTEGICGGRARIRDSRIPVSAIAESVRSGDSREDILALHPQIEPAAIDDAIGYYSDHRPEIEAEIEAGSLEAVLAESGATLGADGVIRFSKKPE